MLHGVKKTAGKTSGEKKALRADKYEESDPGLSYFEQQAVGGKKEYVGRPPL